MEKKPNSNSKSYDVPKYNSSLRSGALIQRAVEDLAKIPSQVEAAVFKTLENPEVRNDLFKKATKKLNLPTSTKLYHDLLDIEKIPEVKLKRVSPVTKKTMDPIPILSDFMSPTYSNVPEGFASAPEPPPRAISTKNPGSWDPELDELNNNFNNNSSDILAYERTFSRLR